MSSIRISIKSQSAPNNSLHTYLNASTFVRCYCCPIKVEIFLWKGLLVLQTELNAHTLPRVTRVILALHAKLFWHFNGNTIYPRGMAWSLVYLLYRSFSWQFASRSCFWSLFFHVFLFHLFKNCVAIVLHSHPTPTTSSLYIVVTPPQQRVTRGVFSNPCISPWFPLLSPNWKISKIYYIKSQGWETLKEAIFASHFLSLNRMGAV